MRLVIGQHHIIGALVMGDQTLSRPLQELIASQADITPIRAQLLDPNAQIGEILNNFWQASLNK